MRMNNVLAEMIRNFFIIFGAITIGTALLNPTFVFGNEEILSIMLFSLVSDLASLVLWSKNELSNISRVIRRIIHLILIEITVIIIGNVLGFASGIVQNIVFGIEIFLIYLIVCFIDWLIDRKTANDINEKLKEMQTQKNKN